MCVFTESSITTSAPDCASSETFDYNGDGPFTLTIWNHNSNLYFQVDWDSTNTFDWTQIEYYLTDYSDGNDSIGDTIYITRGGDAVDHYWSGIYYADDTGASDWVTVSSTIDQWIGYKPFDTGEYNYDFTITLGAELEDFYILQGNTGDSYEEDEDGHGKSLAHCTAGVVVVLPACDYTDGYTDISSEDCACGDDSVDCSGSTYCSVNGNGEGFCTDTRQCSDKVAYDPIGDAEDGCDCASGPGDIVSISAGNFCNIMNDDGDGGEYIPLCNDFIGYEPITTACMCWYETVTSILNFYKKNKDGTETAYNKISEPTEVDELCLWDKRGGNNYATTCTNTDWTATVTYNCRCSTNSFVLAGGLCNSTQETVLDKCTYSDGSKEEPADCVCGSGSDFILLKRGNFCDTSSGTAKEYNSMCDNTDASAAVSTNCLCYGHQIKTNFNFNNADGTTTNMKDFAPAVDQGGLCYKPSDSLYGYNLTGGAVACDVTDGSAGVGYVCMCDGVYTTAGQTCNIV